MLKASALYIVIVIALVMAVLCSSLITAAYFYRQQYQQTFRHSNLQSNLSSGVNILLESTQDYSSPTSFSLFNQDNDTVILKRQFWGMMDMGIAKSCIQKDTLYQVFSMAHTIDSTRWAVLYLIDEDRSLSVSGKTLIQGTTFIPKAGVKEAYVNNQAYQGDKRLVIGPKHNSNKTLPALDANRLQQFKSAFNQAATDSGIIKQDTLKQSFLQRTRIFYFGKKAVTLSNVHISGNVILRSDTSIVIEPTASLNNVLVFARSIVAKSGFQGACQLYARDSVSVGSNCKLNYPSAIGVLDFSSKTQGQPKLILGENSVVSGTLFIYQQTPDSQLQPIIDLGKHTLINGQVYIPGLLNYKDGAVIKGSAFVNRFLYQTDYTRYENYLINIRLNSAALSPYYLTGSLLPVAAKSQKVLQWLEAN